MSAGPTKFPAPPAAWTRLRYGTAAGVLVSLFHSPPSVNTLWRAVRGRNRITTHHMKVRRHVLIQAAL